MGSVLIASLLSATPCPNICEGLQQPPVDTIPVAPGTATEPNVTVTGTWLLLQTLPSPGIAFGSNSPHLRLSWQLTPLLYSFGIDPRLSPWRWLIVEPIVRHSGSVECVLSPEYLHSSATLFDRFGFRALVRSTFGLVERGEYLSLSLGSGYLFLPEGASTEYELGLYTLFGSVGLSAGYAPALAQSRYALSLRLRFF